MQSLSHNPLSSTNSLSLSLINLKCYLLYCGRPFYYSIHVHKSTTQHIVVLQQPLPCNLFMDLFRLANSSNRGTCFQDGHIGHCIWKDALKLHLFKAVKCLLGVTFSCISCSPRDNIPRRQPVEHFTRL